MNMYKHWPRETHVTAIISICSWPTSIIANVKCLIHYSSRELVKAFITLRVIDTNATKCHLSKVGAHCGWVGYARSGACPVSNSFNMYVLYICMYVYSARVIGNWVVGFLYRTYYNYISCLIKGSYRQHCLQKIYDDS